MSLVVLQHPLVPVNEQVVNSLPPLPPPLNPTHLAIHNTKKTISYDVPSLTSPLFSKKYEVDISPNHLLTLLITKRKICLFEASTGDEARSREQFLTEHIETAQLLYHSNLSHSGVPVHPLQFQRYTRSLGVDNDCHVVIYDRGQMIWSTYAAWIFKLFGHQRVSILSGGFLAWKTQMARSAQYHTDSGEEEPPGQGDLLTSWNHSLVITFDDVLLNTELHTYDVVDAQTKQEYMGEASGALYGHIQGAVNVPIDTMYDWKTNKWRSAAEIEQTFGEAGLSRNKPVIVYCSTSLRSSMLWWVLKRMNYDARVYFGGWPEWVVRAPDDMKPLRKITIAS
ncbi:rhodanese-like protein [Necator americanus]|uniref:Rhodanese-like protein n=1 Tax=Necator americanus TaxID=51031 RepID=W2TLF6_NECAM|nr:rhodanese-like protein [Necator americanus]ETN81976.1 rhodanese-like protein [Necator americanus]